MPTAQKVKKTAAEKFANAQKERKRFEEELSKARDEMSVLEEKNSMDSSVTDEYTKLDTRVKMLGARVSRIEQELPAMEMRVLEEDIDNKEREKLHASWEREREEMEPAMMSAGTQSAPVTDKR